MYRIYMIEDDNGILEAVKSQESGGDCRFWA